MLRLRPYKPCDAKTIAGWIKDEISFRKWCSDRFESFPITAEDINRKYINYNGDCMEEDNFYPMTAFDETGIVGHLILRFIDAEKKTIRFGFVIVDDNRRGKGYGKALLRRLAQLTLERGGGRLEWSCLDWNQPSIDFYRSLGARPMEEWTVYRLTGETLEHMARS